MSLYLLLDMCSRWFRLFWQFSSNWVFIKLHMTQKCNPLTYWFKCDPAALWAVHPIASFTHPAVYFAPHYIFTHPVNSDLSYDVVTEEVTGGELVEGDPLFPLYLEVSILVDPVGHNVMRCFRWG